MISFKGGLEDEFEGPPTPEVSGFAISQAQTKRNTDGGPGTSHPESCASIM
jgi:hypothetical protein